MARQRIYDLVGNNAITPDTVLVLDDPSWGCAQKIKICDLAKILLACVYCEFNNDFNNDFAICDYVPNSVTIIDDQDAFYNDSYVTVDEFANYTCAECDGEECCYNDDFGVDFEACGPGTSKCATISTDWCVSVVSSLCGVMTLVSGDCSCFDGPVNLELSYITPEHLFYGGLGGGFCDDTITFQINGSGSGDLEWSIFDTHDDICASGTVAAITIACDPTVLTYRFTVPGGSCGCSTDTVFQVVFTDAACPPATPCPSSNPCGCIGAEASSIHIDVSGVTNGEGCSECDTAANGSWDLAHVDPPTAVVTLLSGSPTGGLGCYWTGPSIAVCPESGSIPDNAAWVYYYEGGSTADLYLVTLDGNTSLCRFRLTLASSSPNCSTDLIDFASMVYAGPALWCNGDLATIIWSV